MKQIKYKDYISTRAILKKHADYSFNFGGFAMFKSLEHAKQICVNPNLFIIRLKIEQWSDTDCYPLLMDGEFENRFGYFVAYGTNQNESALFEDCPF